ncbi:hypothetical protein QF002_001215 [Paraburkholderia youngii]
MTGERRHNVRPGFAEQDVWRAALGGSEPLHVFSIDGDLSAPDHVPAGAMRSTKYGAHAVLSQRS